MKIYTSELLNFSVEIMSSIVKDIIDLLQDKANLSSPYRSDFVIRLKEGAVEEEMGCSFYFYATVIYWVNAVLKIVSKFMITQMTQT